MAHDEGGKDLPLDQWNRDTRRLAGQLPVQQRAVAQEKVTHGPKFMWPF